MGVELFFAFDLAIPVQGGYNLDLAIRAFRRRKSASMALLMRRDVLSPWNTWLTDCGRTPTDRAM
jgi:hypothetical protein